MYRRLLLGIGIAGLLGSALGLPARGADQRIALVDMDRAFSEYYKTQLADAQLKEQAREFTEEREKMQEEFQELQQRFEALREEAQNPALSDTVRVERREEAEDTLVAIREAEQKLREFGELRTKQLQDQQRRMRRRIVEEISEALTQHARRGGYAAVLDSSGQSMNALTLVLYADSRLDITDELIEILNRGRE